MKIKSILNPKNFINGLSDSRIDILPIVCLVAAVILTAILSLFSAVGQDYTETIKTTLTPLGQISGSERFSVILTIFRDVLAMLLVYLIVSIIILIAVNLLIKLILKLFKKKISFYKLMNISVYAILANKFLNLIFLLIIVASGSLFLNLSEWQAYVFVAFPLIIINLLSLILYIYGIVITVKNKFVSNAQF